MDATFGVNGSVIVGAPGLGQSGTSTVNGVASAPNGDIVLAGSANGSLYLARILGGSNSIAQKPTATFDPSIIATKGRRQLTFHVVYTAGESINLQTLGTLINVDLPWNPARLEQRLGRIKRFGQARRTVDMLNLVYHDTQDEQVYQVISRRLKDRFDIFGVLPDTIEDDWIERVERLETMIAGIEEGRVA